MMFIEAALPRLKIQGDPLSFLMQIDEGLEVVFQLGKLHEILGGS